MAVPVCESSGFVLSIPINAAFEWIPGLAKWSRIDLPMLAPQIQPHCPRQNVRKIKAALMEFFALLQQKSSSNIEIGINMHIDNAFNNHRNKFMMRRDILMESRKVFTILAALAVISGSRRIADVLVRIFEYRKFDVLNNEQAQHLFEWVCALDLLRGLASERKIERCLGVLSNKCDDIRNQYHTMGGYDPRIESLLRNMDRMMRDVHDDIREMQRGRKYNHALAWPRARTMPAPIRAVPMLMPAAPAWASAYPSPALNARDGYFCDAEVDELRDRVEQLEFNQEMQMGLPSPIPMAALPWYPGN